MFTRLALGLICSLPGAPALAQTGQVLGALPDSSLVAPCTAAAPVAGARFSGPVMQVLDGGLFCVALGPTPDQWVAVRPSGLSPAAAAPDEQEHAQMMAAAFSKTLDCVAGDKGDGAVDAVCSVEGRPLADEVKAVRTSANWQSWR